MSLNIKNPDTYLLARELSQLTGESLTAAVTHALEERLQKVKGPNRSAELAKDLLAIGADCAQRLREPFKSVDHGDLLYDELGLPR